MNHITLCGKVTTNEIRYTQNNDPLLLLTVRYPHQEQVATLETQVRGDRAIDMHQWFEKDEVVAVTGSIERFKVGTDYHVHVRGQNIVSIDRFVPLNKVVLAGRLGADPDVKRFQNGSVKATFNIAISRGKTVDPTWHHIQVWGSRAEVAENYLRKGSLVGVEGELLWMPLRDKETGAYLKDKQGMPYIKAERLELLGGKSQQEERDW